MPLRMQWVNRPRTVSLPPQRRVFRQQQRRRDFLAVFNLVCNKTLYCINSANDSKSIHARLPNYPLPPGPTFMVILHLPPLRWLPQLPPQPVLWLWHHRLFRRHNRRNINGRRCLSKATLRLWCPKLTNCFLAPFARLASTNKWT